jgi:hypothetical protein
MLMNDCEVEKVVETTTGLTTLPLRYVVMAPALLPEA